MSRIFLTGDCHASYTKLSSKSFSESRALTKDDYVFICGDFGYWEESKRQDYWMDWLEGRPFTTLWVDGNHENYDLLKKLPVEQWNGGKVHFIRPSVIHLMRGQIYEIDGKRFFTFGGARSHDISGGILEKDDPDLQDKIWNLEDLGQPFRINHMTWWKEELPDDKEMQTGIAALEKAGWETDYIITHCCATSLQDENPDSAYESDCLTDYLSTIRKRCVYRHWFFGHYHEDRDWSDKETCLYRSIVELTTESYVAQGLSARFAYHDHVEYSIEGFHGKEKRTGTIIHIDWSGGGFYTGEQPTANIYSDDGHLHKDVPFEDIRKIETEHGE